MIFSQAKLFWEKISIENIVSKLLLKLLHHTFVCYFERFVLLFLLLLWSSKRFFVDYFWSLLVFVRVVNTWILFVYNIPFLLIFFMLKLLNFLNKFIDICLAWQLEIGVFHFSHQFVELSVNLIILLQMFHCFSFILYILLIIIFRCVTSIGIFNILKHSLVFCIFMFYLLLRFNCLSTSLHV